MINVAAAIGQITEMVNEFIAALPGLVIGVLVFLVFFVVARRSRGVVQKVARRSRISGNVVLLLENLVRWLILILGGLVGLSIAIPSFKPGQLVELLGIVSIAIGFAFRDIFQNFLAGILILITEPFRVGDQIVVGEYEGTVEDIQTRATYIHTYDNRRVVIPNADLLTESVTVNTTNPHRRSEYDVGVSYATDIERAKALVLEAMQGVTGVLLDPAPDVLAWELSDSKINIRVRWWTRPRHLEVVRTRDRVIAAIKKKLDANGIEIPFPIRTIYFHNE